MTEGKSEPWAQPGWREQVETWICAELERHALRVTGDVEQLHSRPWSAVLRVPASGGDVYFKATLPRLRHEVELTAALARWQPRCALPVLAADAARGWLLMPDGGTRLRELIRGTHDYRPWEQVLPVYARLQIDLAARVPEMLALGEPDRRPSALPALYTALLGDTESLRIDREHGVTSAEYRRLRELAPAVAGMCAQLAAYGVPDSLNHGDFGDANVFLHDGRPVFFDWGDSAVSHPFFSLRTTFVSLEYSLDLAQDAPEFDRLRDVYLDAWTRYAPHHELIAAFRLARRLAPISSALGWHRVVATLDSETKEQYAMPVPALLQEFLELQDITS